MDNNYLAVQGTGLGCVVMQPIRVRLLERKKSCEEQLSRVNDALAALDKNPEFEQFHDAIVKAGY